MPNLLENAGRSIASLASGPSPDRSAQEARGEAMVANMVGGGAALGGGISILVALANRLKSMKEEQELEDPSRLNDDTLYISAPPEKSAGLSPHLAPGLAVAGSIAAGGLTYAGFQKLWGIIEKNRRLSQLDEAQGETLALADEEALKSAAAAPRLNLGDALTAAPVSIPLLTMIATGGLTYAALNKSFPTVTKPKSKRPKRVRLMREGQPVGGMDLEPEPTEPEVEKLASYGSQDLHDAGSEFLMSCAANLCGRPTLTADFINHAAKGGLDSMESLFKAAGYDALIEAVKGASDVPAPAEDRMLATMALCKSASLAETMRQIAAAEFLDTYRPFYNELMTHEPDHLLKLAHVGCLLGLQSRADTLPELAKKAAALGAPPTGHGLLEALKGMLMGRRKPGVAAQHHEREERDQALTSDVGGGIGGTIEEGALAPGADSNESTGDDDVIDGIMAADRPEQVLEPTD